MKRPWVVVVVLFLVLNLVGLDLVGQTKAESDAKLRLSLLGSVEVMQDVYDDKVSSVYIKVNSPKWNQSDDEAVGDIMLKKRQWEISSPDKKLVAMSIVHHNREKYPVIVGLLIHYEPR